MIPQMKMMTKNRNVKMKYALPNLKKYENVCEGRVIYVRFCVELYKRAQTQNAYIYIKG